VASFLDPILLGAYLTIAGFGLLSVGLFVRMVYRLHTRHADSIPDVRDWQRRLHLVWSLAVMYNLRVFAWVLGWERARSNSRTVQRQTDAVVAAEQRDPVLRSCFQWFLLAYQGYLVLFFVTFAHVLLFVVTPF